MDSATDTTLQKVVGSPIRTSPDHSSLTAPRGVSAFAPSFIGSWRLGIRRVPLHTSSPTHSQDTLPSSEAKLVVEIVGGTLLPLAI